MAMIKKKIDETLYELLVGIFLYEMICWALLIWFVADACRYSAGLWIGAILAFLCAFHMQWSIDRNLTINANNEKGATAYALKSSLIRYAVILCVFVMVCLTDYAYPLASFLGIMGLKGGAYLQPVTHRLINKIKRR